MSFELNKTIKYTEKTTIQVSPSGIYQIEVFGASGNGGEGVAYYYPIGPISSAASGGGGGGGGKAISKVKLNTGDTIVLTLNGVGTDTTAAINSSIETYNTITVTSGENGGNVSISGTSLSQAAGGAGGNASWGNYSNVNGSSGGDGEIILSGASSAPAKGIGGIGGSIDTVGGAGGTGYLTSSDNYVGGSWGNYKGESGKAGYIKVTLISNNVNEEIELPDNPNSSTPGDSTTTPNILTATSIQALKKRVYDELADRKYYGAISSVASQINYNSLDSTIATANEINTDIINPLNLIDDKLIQENINNPIRYSYINNQLITFEGSSNNNTGCREACTGFCSNACGDTCGNGCGNLCTSCGGQAAATSTISCNCDSCTGNCSGSSDSKDCDSCSNSCNDCSGNCGSNCGSKCKAMNVNSTCSSCGGNCGTDACQKLCYTGCTHDCSGNCTYTCDKDCAEACLGRCSTSSSNSTGSTTCYNCSTVCSNKCGSGCKNECTNICSTGCSTSCTSFCSDTSSK